MWVEVEIGEEEKEEGINGAFYGVYDVLLVFSLFLFLLFCSFK